MKFFFVLSIILSMSTILVDGQRLKNKGRTQTNIDQEESIPPPPPPPSPRPKPPPPENVEDRRNIGEFPYRRGETPIFNFDVGDEAFIQTIPSLIEGLHDMAASVVKQRKALTNTYVKVFNECVDCQPRK